MMKTNLVMQTILIALGITAALLSGCENEEAISGTSYSGPATVFHSEELYLDEEAGSCLTVPLPWDAQMQRPNCQLGVEYYREKEGTNFVPFPCPTLSNGTWSDSWQSSVSSKIGTETRHFDVANCRLSPTALPLNCDDSSQTELTDMQENGSGWYYCENDSASDRCIYDTVVSAPLAQEISAHPNSRGTIKLSCSESTRPSAANGVTGLEIGDDCARQAYLSDAGNILRGTKRGRDMLYWLEVQAPQCSQGLCLSTVKRNPDATGDAVAACGDDGTIEECAQAGVILETSECTCRCEDVNGNRAEEDDSLCTCPDNMECVKIADPSSGFPVELQGGYCKAL